MRAAVMLGSLALALALAACQSPPLTAATPPRPATPPGTPAPQAEASGFRQFLTRRGETGRGTPLDLDRAMDAIRAAQGRGRERTPENPIEGCGFDDEIDVFACERGLSREHARLLYKHTKYRKPEPTTKSGSK